MPSHEINSQIGSKCLESCFYLIVDLIALLLKIPIMGYYVSYRSLSCHCNDCNTCLYTLRKYSAVCGAYASHTWIKPNRTVPAPTNNNIVTTQPLLSRPPSIPAQFNVNTNYNGYNRHRTTMYNVNRNVRFNPISHSTCTTSKR